MATSGVSRLLYLDAASVADLSQALDPLEIVRETFLAVRAADAEVGPEAAVRWTAPDGTAARSLALPARHRDSYGCKIINASIGNITRGIPRAHGLIVLFDPTTAAPICLMEGARISALRTAAVSIVALEAIRSLTTVRRVAFLGCGRQSATHLDMLSRRTRLEAVAAYDNDKGRATAFVDEVAPLVPDAAVVSAATPHDAMRGVDVTVAATTTTTPYVPLDWISEGGVFINLSLDDATEELLLGCDHLFVDDWTLVSGDETRLLGRLAGAGRVTGPDEAPPEGGRKVDAALATLLADAYPRPITPQDRIVVNPFGMGVHDVAMAARVYSMARGRGAGLHLPR